MAGRCYGQQYDGLSTFTLVVSRPCTTRGIPKCPVYPRYTHMEQGLEFRLRIGGLGFQVDGLGWTASVQNMPSACLGTASTPTFRAEPKTTNPEPQPIQDYSRAPE